MVRGGTERSRSPPSDLGCEAGTQSDLTSPIPFLPGAGLGRSPHSQRSDGRFGRCLNTGQRRGLRRVLGHRECTPASLRGTARDGRLRVLPRKGSAHLSPRSPCVSFPPTVPLPTLSALSPQHRDFLLCMAITKGTCPPLCWGWGLALLLGVTLLLHSAPSVPCLSATASFLAPLLRGYHPQCRWRGWWPASSLRPSSSGP